VSDRLDFLTWYGLKYKSGKNISYLAAQEDVLIKKVANGDDQFPSYIYEFERRNKPAAEVPVSVSFAKDSDADPMSAAEFKKMREKMVGRTFAIDKLLEKYRHLLKEEQFDAVEDSLNALRKNIRRLKVATLSDAIEKTAFMAEQNDWFEGADLIRRLAASDEQFVKIANLISRPEDLGKVLKSLDEISGFLRQRAIIRELSARDIDIFNLGFGHMPEIGDAAAKLMEAFNGAANKIDDLVSKLRAELQQQTAPKMAPEVVKTLVKPQDLPLVKALEPGVAPAQPEPSGELAPLPKKPLL
jgi:predicted DNA-binding protein